MKTNKNQKQEWSVAELETFLNELVESGKWDAFEDRVLRIAGQKVTERRRQMLRDVGGLWLEGRVTKRERGDGTSAILVDYTEIDQFIGMHVSEGHEVRILLVTKEG